MLAQAVGEHVVVLVDGQRHGHVARSGDVAQQRQGVNIEILGDLTANGVDNVGHGDAVEDAGGV
jgi:hypothetical protein